MSEDDNRVSTQLRKFLRASTVSIYRVSKATGIDEGTLSRFARGQVGLSLQNVDKLAIYLDLVLQQRSRIR